MGEMRFNGKAKYKIKIDYKCFPPKLEQLFFIRNGAKLTEISFPPVDLFYDIVTCRLFFDEGDFINGLGCRIIMNEKLFDFFSRYPDFHDLDKRECRSQLMEIVLGSGKERDELLVIELSD